MTVAAQTRIGLVITQHGRTSIIEDEEGQLHRCSSRRKLERIVCGDQVDWQADGDRSHGVITGIHKRRSVLCRQHLRGDNRPLVANIDQVVITCAPYPVLSEGLIDRYLVAAELIGCNSLLLLNKADMLSSDELAQHRQRLQIYSQIGIELLIVSAHQNDSLADLRKHLINNTSILVGQSGTGKSSLTNALLPDKDIRVGALSEGSGLGQHTTSSSTLYHLPEGGSLIDSPGVRDFRLWKLEAEELMHGFREFKSYLGQCRFHNCRHVNEPNCAVQSATDRGEIDPARLASYRNILEGFTE
ncbi:MAG: small ribosomal subunit biogenesis GTPase RsgA [Gammaproteobacteria bacterium]|nr:small ribosomal subunit biogenesis GTPase RsgA [Gammaproteobacteria bacterium]